ncbi:MAG: glycosyltransferase family 4 protein [Thermomicrobiales bacterium]|nr:glycosyltransferase family 4 protein [Thermomicrobiales bacterium]
MRVLVEASAAFNQGAGIGLYSRNILQRLFAMGEEDRFALLRAPEDKSVTRFDVSRSPNAHLRTLPFSRRNADRLWFRLRAPLDGRIFGGRADCIYSPDFTAPPAFGVPRMITIHDLAFLTQPNHTTIALRRYLEEVVPRQVSGADVVSVVSHATAADVQQYYGVASDRIVVARNAVDERFYGAAPPTAADHVRLGLPERYLVMLGTIEPRKNHQLAFDALELSGVGDTTPLIVVGRPGWGHEAIMDRMADLSRKGWVRHLDNVTDIDVPTILAGACGVVYPSWTEGFGLPVVEGLAVGTPVVASTDKALREAGGEFARYVDPEDADGLAAILQEFAATPPDPLAAAARIDWTRQFSWDSSTSTVYAALQRISR